jgi:ABC-2 type transport system permease protein
MALAVPLAEAAPPRVAGWRTIAGKELADALTSVRFLVVLGVLGLAAAVPVYAATGTIRDAADRASGVPAVFMALFTLGNGPVPSFFGLVGFLAPLLGIAFGFDAVNGERAQGTLPRLLAQPIHRDDLINGKFVAGLVLIAAVLTSVVLLDAGIGLLRLGIGPTWGEVLRIVVWLVLAVIYVGLWLAFASLCSVLLPRAATSALVALGTWLVLTLFIGLIASLVAGALSPVDASSPVADQLAHANLTQLVQSISPTTLYQNATLVLLNPGVTSVGVSDTNQLLQLAQQIPTQFSLQQSLLLVWPHVVVLVGLLVATFAASYVAFLRQEVRA